MFTTLRSSLQLKVHINIKPSLCSSYSPLSQADLPEQPRVLPLIGSVSRKYPLHHTHLLLCSWALVLGTLWCNCSIILSPVQHEQLFWFRAPKWFSKHLLAMWWAFGLWFLLVQQWGSQRQDLASFGVKNMSKASFAAWPRHRSQVCWFTTISDCCNSNSCSAHLGRCFSIRSKWKIHVG